MARFQIVGTVRQKQFFKGDEAAKEDYKKRDSHKVVVNDEDGYHNFYVTKEQFDAVQEMQDVTINGNVVPKRDGKPSLRIASFVPKPLAKV